jgi:hypothetical protein
MGPLGFVRRPALLSHACFMAAALACGVGLGGCVEDTAQAPAAAPPSDNIARRPDVSPAGATVAVSSVSGAPGDLNDKYQGMLAAYAKRDSVSMVDSGASNYLVRGYLSADPNGDGTTTLSYVLDVFDSDKHRTQRVTDEIVVRGQAPDSWSLVSDDVLAALAQKSAGDLAAVMTNTPEAIAASTTPAAAPVQAATNTPAAAPDSGQTVVAATPPSTPSTAAATTQSSGNGYGMTAQR